MRKTRRAAQVAPRAIFADSRASCRKAAGEPTRREGRARGRGPGIPTMEGSCGCSQAPPPRLEPSAPVLEHSFLLPSHLEASRPALQAGMTFVRCANTLGLVHPHCQGDRSVSSAQTGVGFLVLPSGGNTSLCFSSRWLGLGWGAHIISLTCCLCCPRKASNTCQWVE